MSTVTNGTVEFERVMRPADFESKRVRVTLSYAVVEGEDPAAAASRVGDMAHAEVFRMLAKAEKAAAVKPPKVDPPAEVAQPNPPVEEPVNNAPTPTSSSPAPAGAGEQPNPTDAELQASCQRARARGCTPDQLKALIASMVAQPGMRIIHITDPAGRANALAAMDALQPGAAAADDY